MPRPTKYNEITVGMICDALKLGNTRTCACNYAGISLDTFERWMKSFAEFCGAVTRAEAEVEICHVAVIQSAAKDGDWRASLEWLKRRRREEWGDNITHDIDKEIQELMAELVASRKEKA